MARLATYALLATASCVQIAASGTQQASQLKFAANPVRKVVNMLQAMQKKVAEEGEKEKELYEKFLCYCKTGGSDLSTSIAAATTKLGDLATDISTSESKHAQVSSSLEQAQADRAAGEKSMSEATALREKEATVYAQFKADSTANLAALAKAISSIESGMQGGFLQTSAASTLRKWMDGPHRIEDDDHQVMASFLAGGSAYAPQSGQISGILKTMHDEMSADFADATSAENAAIEAYKELMGSRLKEKAALTTAIQTKLTKKGELGVSIAEMKNDAGDTAEALSADQKFLAALQTGCATKTSEWEARSTTRADELVALADTIKILNDDDALELFKKTLPSSAASLVQVEVSTFAQRSRALQILHQSKSSIPQNQHVGLDLISLALRGKKVGFEKVITMIESMLAGLKEEQVDDDHKKTYCAKQLDASDDQKKALQRDMVNIKNSIAVGHEAIATLTDDIASLTRGIQELDKSVADATANRKAEHDEYNELIASNSAATEVLGLAKNRLRAFYNPKLAKTTTVSPPAFVQISQHAQSIANPGPPSETWNAYVKQSEANGGVVEMLNLLIADLDKEMTEAKAEENNAQSDYETLMQDSAEKRAADSTSLSEKERAKAETEASVEGHSDDLASAGKELGSTMRYIASLHAECDWLLKYFQVRQQARADEMDSLRNAKAVLSGADYTLVQVKSSSFLGRIVSH